MLKAFGVVSSPVFVAIPQYPSEDSELFSECYTGHLENTCMHSKGKVSEIDKNAAGPMYRSWLQGSPCDLALYQEEEGEMHIVPSSGTGRVMKAVPKRCQRRHRWGWLNTQSIFRLDELWTQYPGLIFIHIVRNPLDMAASIGADLFLPLRDRAKEFASIHGGYLGAADAMTKRCEGIRPAKDPHGFSCRIPAKTIKELAECTGKHCMTPASSAQQEPWQCMQCMLWAEINTAVHDFGQRCLIRSNRRRYVVWHSEDAFNLRGPVLAKKLVQQLSDALGIKQERVVLGMENGTRGVDHPPAFSIRNEVGDDSSQGRSRKCANAAIPGVLDSFGYSGSSGFGEYDLEEGFKEPASSGAQVDPLLLQNALVLVASICVVLVFAYLMFFCRCAIGATGEGTTQRTSNFDFRDILAHASKLIWNLATTAFIIAFSFMLLYGSLLAYRTFAIPVLRGDYKART